MMIMHFVAKRAFRPALPAAVAVCMLACQAAFPQDTDPGAHDEEARKIAVECGEAGLAETLLAIQSFGSRAPGSEAQLKAGEWLEQRLHSVGFITLARQRFNMVEPVEDVPWRLTVPGPGGSGGFECRVHPLRPNMIVPPNVPDGRLVAPLQYAKSGRLGDFDGLRPGHDDASSPAIIVMDFNSGDRWHNAAMLGAAAALFLPNHEATFAESMQKAGNVPVSFPRFYLEDTAAAESVLEAAASGSEAVIEGRTAWRNVTGENILLALPAPGADPDAETLLLTVPYDASGIVPGCAPGGQGAETLAAALAALETLADPALAARRRHHLLVLLDGGRSSANSGLRAFASVVRDLNLIRLDRARAGERELTQREVFLARKLKNIQPWMQSARDEIASRVIRLQAACSWIESGGDPQNVPEDRDLITWLHGILKDRIQQQQLLVLSLLTRAERDSAPISEIEALQARAAYYRVLAAADSPAAAMEAMMRESGAAPLEPDDITAGLLLADFRSDLEEARRAEELLDDAFALRDALDGWDMARHIAVDISSGNSILTLGRMSGIGGDRGYESPAFGEWSWSLGPMISQNLERIARFANRAVAADTPAFSFIDSITFDASRPVQAQAAEFYETNLEISPSGISGVALVTANDAREFRLGPGDVIRLDPVSLSNLAVQSRTLALLVQRVLMEPELMPHPNMNTPQLASVAGQVVMRDVRSGPFPRLPVSQAVVLLPGLHAVYGSVFCHRIELADRAGNFLFDSVPAGRTFLYGTTMKLSAFRLSERTGSVEYAPDDAMSSRGGYETSVNPWQRRTFRRLVVFKGSGVEFHGCIDPMVLLPYTSTRLVDGRGGSFENRYVHVPSTYENTMFAFVPQGSAVKGLFALSGLSRYFSMLLLGDQSESVEGAGWPVPDDGLNLVMTPALAARNLVALNADRLGKLNDRGVRNKVAESLHSQSEEDLALMDGALGDLRFMEAMYHARNAWGRALRAYPKILGAANEAVIAVVLLMAFLAPWAVFMERIVFGSGGLGRRMLGGGLLFLAAFAAIYLLHPAFSISATPIMIFIAYALAALGLLALGVVFRKYSAVMKKWRQRVGGIHSSDISRAGAFSVAFSLGLTNLAKRPLRTALTILMIALLTFSMMTFTSVNPSIDTRRVPVRGQVEPAYEGLLFRLHNWSAIPAAMADTFESDLGPGARTIRRMWRQISEQGWQIAMGNNKFVFTRADTGRSHTSECLQGFMVHEGEFSRLPECIVGSWFSGALDEVIIPSAAAKALGVTGADVLGVPPAEQVRIFHGGRSLRVIGILDTAAADELRDISGEPLSHVDYYSSGVSPSAGLSEPAGEELDVVFMSFDRCVLLPYGLLRDLGGTVRNIAARFPGRDSVEPVIAALTSRFAANIFASVGGRSYLVKTAGSQSVQGAWKILLPMLMVILIMVNTMYGAVDERVEEIKMLGAVGLAPSHVSVLYLAESCVYGMLGVVFGIMLGLLTAWSVRHQAIGVSLNYATIPTMTMGIVVMGIVVAATYIPALRAARLATPSGAGEWSLPEGDGDTLNLKLPFAMTRDNGVGIFAFLHEYLASHRESTSADFRCDSMEADAREDALVLRMHLWLAPYDIGVSQEMRIELRGVESDEVFHVRIEALRLSGELSIWRRANFRFIDLLRGQFLIFRTLPEKIRNSYVESAPGLFMEGKRNAATAG